VGGAAELAHDGVEGLDEVGEVFGVGEDATPATRVRQRADQQVSVLTDIPRRWWVREFHPVELGFLARWVRDDRDVAAAGDLAGFAVRAQLMAAQRASERRVAAGVAQGGELVEQGRGPQVRVVGQPGPAVADVRLERVWACGSAAAGFGLAGEVTADCFAVTAEMSCDGRDRPALRTQRLRFHVFLQREHPPSSDDPR
jgi:hypothetical protein